MLIILIWVVSIRALYFFLYDDDGVYLNKLLRGVLQNLLSTCTYVKHSDRPWVKGHRVANMIMIGMKVHLNIKIILQSNISHEFYHY
jgi:hypothetical protein